MPAKIQDLLGEEEATENPLTATPDGEKEGDNPLEKMDKISKEKPQKKGKDSTELDGDIIAEMIKTGENTDGLFTPTKKEKDEEDKLHEDEDDKAKVTVGKDVKPKGKYEKDFKNDMLKHPDEYKVNTPRGEMTVAEAIRAGYNPITKKFEKERSQEAIKEKHLSGLNEADRMALEKFTSPESAQVAPADAEMYGLKANSPLIRQQQNSQIAPSPAMPGGIPTPGQGASDIGNSVGTPEESTAPGGLNLDALLGGGK